jgi:NAD(P)H-flavin reductase
MGHKIVSNEIIAPSVFRMVVEAPEVAKYKKAGQFVVVRPTERGERIPLTTLMEDKNKGLITLIYQVVGKTTAVMALMEPGEELCDVAGPLGQPTHIERFGTVIAIGGGIGTAPLYPIVQAMKEKGNYIISILGARSKPLLILENEMRQVSDEVVIVTDDGSYGEKGFVTDALQKIIERGTKPDFVIAIGPAIMMKMVAILTKPYNIKTVASLNTIMVDGTGMCGSCRVTVGGETKFVCVDGPEFDAHQIDFDEMMKRLSAYKKEEEESFKLFFEQNKERLARRNVEVRRV